MTEPLEPPDKVLDEILNHHRAASVADVSKHLDLDLGMRVARAEVNDSDAIDPIQAKRYADVLLAAQEGSTHALDEVIAELSPMLWRVARSTGLDRRSSEDVVQTTWLALLHSMSTIDNPAVLPGWLAMTALRESWKSSRDGRRDYGRVKERSGLALDQPALDEDATKDESLGPGHRALWQSIRRLPTRWRALIQVIAYTAPPYFDLVVTSLGVPRGAIGPHWDGYLAEVRRRLNSNPESPNVEGRTGT